MRSLIIKYTSCDCETIVDEKVMEIEFYEIETKSYKGIELSCTRADDGEFIRFGKTFTVNSNRVHWIKVHSYLKR